MAQAFERTLAAVGLTPEERAELRAQEAAKKAAMDSDPKFLDLKNQEMKMAEEAKWLDSSPENRAWHNDLTRRQARNAEVANKASAYENRMFNAAQEAAKKASLSETPSFNTYIPDEVARDIDVSAFRKAGTTGAKDVMEKEAKYAALKRLGTGALSAAGKVGRVAGKLLGPVSAAVDLLDPTETVDEDEEMKELRKNRGF